MLSSLGLKAGDIVVDPTCGEASLLYEAHQYCAGVCPVGFDYSSEALEKAHNNLQVSPAQIPNPVDFIHMDVSIGLPLRDDSVDAVVGDPPFGVKFGQSLETARMLFLPILSECLRVLRPGGRAVFLMSADQTEAFVNASCLLSESDRRHSRKVWKLLDCQPLSLGVLFLVTLVKGDSLTESLHLKPLPSGHLQSLFQISVSTGSLGPHFDLFPRSLAEILTQFNVDELHLSLTQGQWRHEKWGYQRRPAPVGMELWVWFHKQVAANVSSHWSSLCQTISGLLCASIERVGKERVTDHAQLAFERWDSAEAHPEGVLLKHAMLPREVTCTENLTPWIKLSPCGTKSGVGQLWTAARLLDSHYFSVALDYYRGWSSAAPGGHHLTLSLTVVQEVRSWSLKQLFGSSSGILASCPLSSSALVTVDVSDNFTYPFRLSPAPETLVTLEESGVTLAVYDLKNMGDSGPFNLLASPVQREKVYGLIPLPVITVQRFMTGYGQTHGGIMTKIHNSDRFSTHTVTYTQNIPWFIHMFLHSLKIAVNGEETGAEEMRYVPGVDRERPYLLELKLRLPPKSKAEISFEFETSFLKWTEYPPDANHGFYIPSAVLEFVPNDSRNQTVTLSPHRRQTTEPPQRVTRVYTEALLVTLPTPDFSMPYNVICLACTAVALAFGPLHNLTTKRLMWISPPRSLRQKLTSFLSRFRKTGDEKKEN
ncbi:unnamed protein product [Cyprideis torosa]|uniref:tRNA (guanine(10)-N(2))-methyltransferase TRMT11 n=1 Tax=Cyprideis torosa TaxID=163714 RepID=A0A7R8WGU1_9CRUS|nr:unnamed protein product [Cyprideis torosa]CAG0893374.1 unnamed protein product [Cyprideis torosa]